MGRRYRRPARTAAVSALTAMAAAACGVTGHTPTSLSGLAGPPITIGVSLPLTGQFSANGQASLKGYQLWASDVNGHGGLLGRPVKLVLLNDGSDPLKTARDYTTLIARDRVDLTLAPFSSLLTAAAARVTDRYGYALAAGSAGSPTVYRLHSRGLFSTSVPIATQMQPLADWIMSLPPRERPDTAAYPTIDDPFAAPPVENTQKELAAAGIRTVYSHVYPPNVSLAQLSRDAAAVAALKPALVVLGSVDVPTAATFINKFAGLGCNPKIFIAAAGPEQGQAFINAVGTANAVGVMVPSGWYRSDPNPLSHIMVQDYIARYGGTSSGINADVAEAYSAGQVLAQGVTGAGAVSNKAVIGWLHTHEIQTVLGASRFSASGENLDALRSALIFQWQPGARFIQVLPSTAAGSIPPSFPKPPWGG